MNHMGTNSLRDKNRLAQIPKTAMPWLRGSGAVFFLSCAHVKLWGTESSWRNVASGCCVSTTGGGDQGQTIGQVVCYLFLTQFVLASNLPSFAQLEEISISIYLYGSQGPLSAWAIDSGTTNTLFPSSALCLKTAWGWPPGTYCSDHQGGTTEQRPLWRGKSLVFAPCRLYWRVSATIQ